MDNSTLRFPPGFYLAALIFFALPGVVLLFGNGHWGAAGMMIFALAYAVGLGRTLIWRRLGKPRVPPRR